MPFAATEMQLEVIILILSEMSTTAFPGGSDGKVSAYNVGDLGSIPVRGRSSGEGNGNLL